LLYICIIKNELAWLKAYFLLIEYIIFRACNCRIYI